MKTKNDLEQMKQQQHIPFGTEYNYFISRLEGYYISKSDGVERIRAELIQWDKETQQIIAENLVENILTSGMSCFDKNEILSLVKQY